MDRRKFKVIMYLMVVLYTGSSANILFNKQFKNENSGRLKEEGISDVDTSKVTYKLQDADECYCKGGTCVEEKGKLVCTCPSEFGLAEEGKYTKCKPCNCGKDSNCTIDVGFFQDTISCICKEGYKAVKNVCQGPCSTNSCKNGGSCADDNKTFKCICPTGYYGKQCEDERKLIGLCTKNPCKNGGTCADVNKTYKCICLSGYTGTHCEHKNLCFLNPCLNGGTCNATGKSFKCSCPTPFFGDLCQKDPCTWSPCQNGGTCRVGKIGFTCSCKTPFKGPRCENACSCGDNEKNCRFEGRNPRCDCVQGFLRNVDDGKCHEECSCKGGTCVENKGKLVCTCPSEFGLIDAGPTTRCEPCNCGKDSNCTIETGWISNTIKCICKEGYKVLNKICQGPCTVNPCKNGGTCADENNAYKCICPLGYSGKQCENKACDCGVESIGCTFENSEKTCFCKHNYASNDGKCEVCDCGRSSECIFEYGMKKCSCRPNYALKSGACEACDCGENGNCRFSENDEKVCDCEPKYLEKEGICKPCDCGENGNCRFSETDEKVCVCEPKYAEKEGICKQCDCGNEGTCHFNDDYGTKVCDCNRGFISINGKCENPCASNLCKNDGVCILNGTDFMCECKSPYFGKLCQFHLCHANPCSNDGACIAVEDDYGCVCKEPFHGRHCEIDPCSSGPCMNEGMCSVVGIDFKCTCKTPYFGKQCELDPCSSNPCKNNGICNADYDKYHCYCKMPFFGPTCEEIVTTESHRSMRPELTTKLDEVNNTLAEINRTEFFTTEQVTINDEVNSTLTERNRTEFYTTEQVTINDDCYCGINSLNCYFVRGQKICKCKDQYAQRNGTCAETCQFNSDCLNGGLCQVQGGRYFCKCPDVYLGDRCQIDVCRDIRYTCAASGAVCRRKGDTGVCKCPNGKAISRSSGRCKDICNYDTCEHGSCKIIKRKYKCVCYEGFTGRHCNKRITQVRDAVPLGVLILILSVGIVMFATAAIIAICWVKRLKGKILKN